MEAKKITPPQLPPGPILTAEGIKVYPTSWIPMKAPLEPSRIPTAQLANLHIEVIHVIMFFLMILGLYWSMWGSAKIKKNRP